MNESLFVLINSFVGKISTLDLLGVLTAQYMPYLFIVAEVYIYFGLKKKNEAIFAFYAMLIGLLFNQIIGLLYFHNRPFMDGIGISLIHHVGENSFPSDHTTFIMAISIALFMQEKTKNLGKILLPLALLGGISRVFVGVHYPFDIIGSIIIATFSAFVVIKQKEKLQYINDIILKIDRKIFRYENLNY
jgi:undecaprenyl-diphosphatase